MAFKTGRRLASHRCKWCGTWNVYECGYPHRGLFGSLSCSQCKNSGRLCTDSKHPHNKHRSDV
jgi:hypothetical protein